MALRLSKSLGQNPVISAVVGTLIGLSFALLLRETDNFGLGSIMILGLLLALGRSAWVPLRVKRDESSGELMARLPYLEQVIGYLVCLLWLDQPSLLALCVGFFLYRFLDVYPTPLARRQRMRGTRDRILMGQLITGSIALGCLTALRFTLLPGMWSVV
jgi:hypothetical protein